MFAGVSGWSSKLVSPYCWEILFHLFLALAFFSRTCCWGTWSYLVIGLWCCLLLLVINCPYFRFEVVALGNICFLIPGLFCGTSLPPWVGGLKNICISFIPHTTSKRFVCPLPSDRAALLLLHHIGCGPRLKAGLPREFAASPRQHLEEWAAALMLLLFDIYLSVSAVHFPYPMEVWNLTSLLYSFHDFLFLSEVEYFLFLFFSFPIWLRISLHNVIFSRC